MGAGGPGPRLSEETGLRPKPMLEIGEHPILWHIMQIYAAHGFSEFLVALGYKGDVIKDYFLNFYARNADLTVRLGLGKNEIHPASPPDWTVHMVDTGLATQTGGRMKRLPPRIGHGTFLMPYGDRAPAVRLKSL